MLAKKGLSWTFVGKGIWDGDGICGIVKVSCGEWEYGHSWVVFVYNAQYGLKN